MKVDAHLHLSKIDDDSLKYILENDICAIGSCHRLEEVEFAKKLRAQKAEKTGKIFISAGVHPFDLDEKKLEMVENLARKKEIDAIGEIGLDKFSKKEKMSFEIQRKFLEKQLELAIEYKLPVILHIRKAMNELFEYEKLLKEVPAVIFHSYSGSLSEAEHILKKVVNAFFSFGTTLGNGHKKAIEVVKKLPIENLLTETDAPYQPFKGNSITEVKDIERVVDDFSKIRKCDAGYIKQAVYGNLFRFLK
jgi:TatD DNase family protein